MDAELAATARLSAVVPVVSVAGNIGRRFVRSPDACGNTVDGDERFDDLRESSLRRVERVASSGRPGVACDVRVVTVSILCMKLRIR